MQHLRMLSNSAAVGIVAAVYLTLLVLQLNPSVPATMGAVASVFAVVGLAYGSAAAVLTWAIYVSRQLAGFELTNPAWVSLRILAWSSGAASGAVAGLCWLHARGMQTTLDPSAPRTLTRTAIVLGVASALLLATAVTRTFVRRAPVVVAAMYGAIAVGAVVIAVAMAGPVTPARPRSTPPAPAPALPSGSIPRVIVLLIDGASLDVISPAVASGRLPNFGRILDAGASMHLATTRPTQPETAWASAFTGKWPSHHGIRGAARYRPFVGGPALDIVPDYLFSQALVRFGLLVEEPYSFASEGALPLWQLLSQQGVTSGIIGIPLTYPAGAMSGFMISDRFRRTASGGDASRAFFPAAVGDEARTALVAASGDVLLPAGAAQWGVDVRLDEAHHALARHLARARDVDVLAVRYSGLDSVAHYYLRYAMPDSFGDVSDQERQDFGRVLDDYYGYLDAVTGEAVSRLRPGDLLLVVSGFGMEPLTPGKRLVERLTGNARLSGTHERAPDGFLLAFGASVAAGRMQRGAVVDLTPTLLYFIGLPVARDMDGFARTDLFTTAFNEERAITFIPTYDR